MNLTGYDFTEEDLRSNRRGFITPQQKKWLEGMAQGIRGSKWGNFPLVIFFLILGFGIFFGMALPNESMRKALFADPLALGVLCATVPVVLGIVGLGQFFGNRRATRLAQAEMKTAEGTISLDEEHSRVGATYYVYIGETEFTFGEDMSRVFPETQRCRIHYCETSMLKLILSYEFLN